MEKKMLQKKKFWCQEISLDPETLAVCYKCIEKYDRKKKVIECVRSLIL